MKQPDGVGNYFGLEAVPSILTCALTGTLAPVNAQIKNSWQAPR